MKRSQRLQVIVDLKSNQEKKQLEVLGIQQVKKQQKETQLNHLKAYRQDYLQKNEQRIKTGVSVVQLMEFRAFIEKIDKAIEGEELALNAISKELQRLRKIWEEAHLYTKNIQKVQKNAQVNEQKQVDKKEQLEMDEHAARGVVMGGIDNA